MVAGCQGDSMRAITVVPGKRDSVALTDMPEPPMEDGPVLVRTQAIGICGTDLEIISGEYGSAPPGQDSFVIGHESLGRVAEAASGTGFGPGDLVVGIVRRRDPVPCPACAAGHWDMCMNGQYTERALRAVTATRPSATASTLRTWSRWIPPSTSSACCSSLPP